MNEAVHYIIAVVSAAGGGGIGAILTAYFMGLKTKAEAEGIKTDAQIRKDDADSKRVDAEKDAEMRRMREYVETVSNWSKSVHAELSALTLERDSDRRNLKEVKDAFTTLDRNYQDVRQELYRERAVVAKVTKELEEANARVASSEARAAAIEIGRAHV